VSKKREKHESGMSGIYDENLSRALGVCRHDILFVAARCILLLAARYSVRGNTRAAICIC